MPVAWHLNEHVVPLRSVLFRFASFGLIWSFSLLVFILASYAYAEIT